MNYQPPLNRSEMALTSGRIITGGLSLSLGWLTYFLIKHSSKYVSEYPFLMLPGQTDPLVTLTYVGLILDCAFLAVYFGLRALSNTNPKVLSLTWVVAILAIAVLTAPSLQLLALSFLEWSIYGIGSRSIRPLMVLIGVYLCPIAYFMRYLLRAGRLV